MTVPFVITLVATGVSIAVYLAFFVGYLQRRRHQPPSYLPGRSTPALELVWALLPVALLAVLIVGAFLAQPVPVSQGAAPAYATADDTRRSPRP